MRVFVGVVTLMALVESSVACMCFPANPEEMFCRSSLVIAGIVDNVKEIFYEGGYSRYFGYPDQLQHNVTVIKVFRNTDEDVKEGETLSFYTPGMGLMCGITLATDTVYLITANKWNGKLRFGLCSWLPTMWRLTEEEILGIQGGYECK